MEDFLDPRNAEGMPSLADSAITMDFLMGIKTGIRNYSFAITESASPELIRILHRQMEASIGLHTEVSDFMMKKGWLHPHNLKEQVPVDLKAAETAIQIAELNLFPRDNDRQGMFATPNQ